MKKKNDLKKMALLGITGGMIVAAQTPATVNAHEFNSAPANLLAAKCGNHGCSTAYNERGYGQNNFSDSTSNDYYYPQGQSSCSSSPSSYQGQSSSYSSSHGCQNTQGYQSRGGNHGCSSFTADNDMQSSPLDQPIGSTTMSESEFKAKLSPMSRSDYDKLSADGKDKALKMASHDCAGKNSCKGQNSCKTDKNDCAGQGSCRGQSAGVMTPDQAVKAASMQEKRSSMNNRNSNNIR